MGQLTDFDRRMNTVVVESEILKGISKGELIAAGMPCTSELLCIGPKHTTAAHSTHLSDLHRHTLAAQQRIIDLLLSQGSVTQAR